MSGEGTMDEVDTDTAPDADGDVGVDDVVSNGDLANRRRRQQVRQACQQCRRRKIKCDEVRPICRPCLKARLACAYELPPGQTRAQAMVENQQRLREELHSHTSLIHALRCTDANSSIQMLSRLRRGEYDSALLGTESTTRSNSPGGRVYPWEEGVDESQRRRSREADALPPIESFPPGRHDNAHHYLPPRIASDKHEYPYDRVPTSAQAFPPTYQAPQNMPGSMMGSSSMHPYDSRMPAYPRPDLQYQQRGDPRYQQSEIPHPSTLPSNDPNQTHQRPR